MQIFQNGKMTDVVKIKAHELMRILKSKRNIFIYGPMGHGKSSIVREYAEQSKLKLKVINLAQKLAEWTGGIPYATKDGYFKELLSEELQDVMADKGEGWILFFDEMNQASQEVMNTLYGICYPMGEHREWAGHDISKAQIVGAGNLDDGTDGTVYLTPIPSPLHDRFHVYELKPDRKDTTDYLKKKWENIPSVTRYIEAMLDADINPRNIDEVLSEIFFADDWLLIEAKVGSAVTARIKEIKISIDKKEKVKSMDPAQKLKAAKRLYELFKENGQAEWGVQIIQTEEELISMLKSEAGLTDEEVASIVKGSDI